MMKYTLTRRKKSVVAADDSEFVSWIRKNDLQFCSDNKAFMELYAYRNLLLKRLYLQPITRRYLLKILKKITS